MHGAGGSRGCIGNIACLAQRGARPNALAVAGAPGAIFNPIQVLVPKRKVPPEYGTRIKVSTLHSNIINVLLQSLQLLPPTLSVAFFLQAQHDIWCINQPSSFLF